MALNPDGTLLLGANNATECEFELCGMVSKM